MGRETIKRKREKENRKEQEVRETLRGKREKLKKERDYEKIKHERNRRRSKLIRGSEGGSRKELGNVSSL